jgi:hypothetical protein
MTIFWPLISDDFNVHSFPEKSNLGDRQRRRQKKSSKILKLESVSVAAAGGRVPPVDSHVLVVRDGVVVQDLRGKKSDQGVNVMITNFSDFCQYSKKNGVFS